jgi:hypothetical protein
MSRNKIAHLNKLVPSAADNDRVLGVRAESYARNPVRVALLGDGELAVTESVPELDCSIAGSGDDLSVVGGEGNGENIVGVANKSAVVVPVESSQRRRVLSQEAERAYAPSEEMT